ncbi:MAG: ComEC/Rec2 family competence protein [Ruminococcaceae bacterium]|nr:ComEC/Rec2 family competence protein [Oscillospiraceae bacterium]
MGIFRCRPLALGAVILAACIAIALQLSRIATLWVTVVAAISFLAVLIPAIRTKKDALCYLAALLLIFVLSFGCVFAEKQCSEAPLEPRLDSEVAAEVKILEIYESNGYGARLLVRVTELEGARRHAKALLVLDGVSPFYLGDVVAGRFYCTDMAEHSRYVGQERECRADGAYLALIPSDAAQLTLAKDGTHSLRARLADWRGDLHQKLLSLIDSDAVELISAMLLGTREALSGEVKRDFRRAGLSHLLAISGLHLAIISMLLDRFMILFRLPKKLRIIVTALFCLGYLFITGCSYSVMRAVFMLLLLHLSFFLRADHDPLTSLGFGASLILLFAPSAMLDLSFQMTMLATFGLLAYGELQGSLRRRLARRGLRRWLQRLLRWVLSSLAVTLFATVAVLPVQWLTFGEISLLTPLSNLIVVPLSTPLMILGILAILSSSIPVIGRFLLLIASWIAKVMLHITAWLSGLGGVLSLRYGFVPYILIPFFVLTVLFLVVRLKRRFFIFLPVAAATLAFAVCFTVTGLHGRSRLDVIYRTTGTQDGILMVQNGSAMICDLSGGSMTQLYEHYKTLQEATATEIDVLMLTHYHEQQVRALSRFAATVTLHALWLPTPLSESDREVLPQLLEIAANEDIAVTVYDYEVPLTVFDSGTVTLSWPLYTKRSVEPALQMMITYGEESICYQSAAYAEYAALYGLTASSSATECLLLGGHGPRPHREIEVALSTVPQEIVLSSADVALQYSFAADTHYRMLPERAIYRLE